MASTQINIQIWFVGMSRQFEFSVMLADWTLEWAQASWISHRKQDLSATSMRRHIVSHFKAICQQPVPFKRSFNHPLLRFFYSRFTKQQILFTKWTRIKNTEFALASRLDCNCWCSALLSIRTRMYSYVAQPDCRSRSDKKNTHLLRNDVKIKLNTIYMLCSCLW